FYGPGARGRRHIHRGMGSFSQVGVRLAPLIREFKLAEERWDSPVSAAIGRRSVTSWLDEIDAPDEMRNRLRAFRGFFLACPEHRSLLALVEQFAESGPPGRTVFHRVKGGNDRLATALVK